MTEEILHQIEELLSLALEREITEEQIQILNSLIKNKPARLRYVVRYLQTNSALKLSNKVANMGESWITNDSIPDLLTESLMLLAEEEKVAPAIEIPKEEPKKELIQKVVYPPREKRKISKISIFSLVMSAAAVLFVVIFVNVVPEKEYSVAVATLVDQVDTRWIESVVDLETGSRLWTDEAPLRLDKGIAKIQYDNGVHVLIEGPAVFGIDRSGIYLQYGLLYSRVSEAGKGFSIETPTSRFIDLGTEFGVQADINGSTELHVVKGEVQFFAGSNGNSRTGQLITENQALRYDASQGRVKTIPVKKTTFIRNIDSKTTTTWRGERKIDLADIVSGGNGLTKIRQQRSIWPGTGDVIVGPGKKENMEGDYTYHPVEDNVFVDGVFVPSLEQGLPQVTSTGDVFSDCPSTSNNFWVGVLNPKYFKNNIATRDISRMHDVYQREAIFLHSNAGITFDLNKIRAAYSLASVREFRAECLFNMADIILPDPVSGTIDFWVLVDGQVRYQNTDVKDSEVLHPVQVLISDQDRFLSLVVTDGVEDEADQDWGYFVEPVLIFNND